MRNWNRTSTGPYRPGLPSVFLTGILVTFGLLFVALRPASAELKGPQASDRQVSLIVSSLLRREHLSRHPLDDEISARALGSFLNGLDPMKVYFDQADVDEFMRQRDQLDDFLASGDISFAYTIFNRFLKRVEQRVATVNDLLQLKHDFTRDEEIVTDPEAATYAATPEEGTDRWRKRVKFDLLLLKADKIEGQEALDKLTRRYNGFAKRMNQLRSDDLLEMYLTAITSSFDPHTTYMSPSTLENFNISMKLNLEGIGAALQVEDGYTLVKQIIPGGAADKKGQLKPQDRIVSVGQGEDGEMFDVVDMNLTDVVNLIRGKAGTVVRLGVIPDGSTETRIYSITRAKVELKDSEARGQVIEEGRKPDGKPYRIGVIDLPSFYMDMSGARRGLTDFKSTTRDVAKILEDFRSQGVDIAVLDLRRNGGGSLTEAINLTGLFIDQGPVVQVKTAAGEVQHYDDLDPGMAWEGPLVVLVSKFSASASEILAGAIQDYRRGLVVGDTATHGKGTVQSLLELGSQLFRVPNPPNLGALKITMQQFYRPNGDSTQKRGVLADIVLPSLTNHMDVAESDLDYAIEFDAVQPAEFGAQNLVSPQMLEELRSRSAARQQQSEDFTRLLKNIERYRKQKSRQTATLNEEKFFAERAEFDAEKEDEKQLEEQIDSDRPVVDRNYYFDEALAITLDYLQMLEQVKVAKIR